jgi:GNAT superfamily N-acetyltransferase
MRLRIATESDAPAIHDLHLRSARQLWVTRYDTEQIEGWIEGRTPEGYLPGIRAGEMFVAEEESELVGFGHARPGTVAAIFVEPAAVGRGVGTALLERAIAMARRRHAGAIRLAATLNAEGFYAGFGFVPVERKSIEKSSILFPVVIMKLAEAVR